MEQSDDNLRERLLARLPKPENLAAYREETASLLAKHERAVSTEKWIPRLLFLCAVGAMGLLNWQGPGFWATFGGHTLFIVAGCLFLSGGWGTLRHWTYLRSVEILKEVKQVQVQVLEIQAALEKSMTSGS